MAHHHRNSSSSRRIDKRLDSKRQRATTRSVITGGHQRIVRASSWSVRLDQPPLIGDETTGGVRTKSSARWCRGRVGREHLPVRQIIYYSGAYSQSVYVCSRCGKRFWNLS